MTTTRPAPAAALDPETFADEFAAMEAALAADAEFATWCAERRAGDAEAFEVELEGAAYAA